MARYTGPKNKLARQVGQDLNLKSNPLKVARRLNVRPGQHGRKMRRKVSDYGRQLQEKQKVRYVYGVQEKYLRKVYATAMKTPLATGQQLLKLLERRLDNVVFRLGFAPTRAAARQIVNHGHISVNGRKVNIPSFRVSVGDVVQLGDKAAKIPYIAEQLANKNTNVPKWLEREATAGKVSALPEREDITEGIEEQLVVEFYSR
ncbi:30S ribosomal protein S4 [Candidatus Woesebacteria bacterium]|nr:30S ribosomal protein S4 [Candidatus Woesebacteria bacterium]MCD8507620.1 30S ribosomal protein S4 [Candidatus Woesebacteria bacterium]MCD8526794.1 30S ribosomal protein S4 [Candidatus Woesebacteria bacterium]MCD8546460.1 30S ribosomal protein S4 [Candidatus Woesebacteria bacterium]